MYSSKHFSMALEFLIKNTTKILFVLFVLAVFFRIFSIMVVPEPAYNDSVYHLELAKSLVSGGEITKETPPFAYHLIVGAFFYVTGLPMLWPFVKIIPLFIFLLSTLLAFLLFRRLFPKTYLFPTIFFVAFPWAVRIGSVNMVDSFSTFVVLLFTFFLYYLITSTDSKKFVLFSALCAFSFILISFSKTNVLFLSPVLLLGYLFFSYKKIGLKKTLPLFALALLFNFSFILISMSAPVASEVMTANSVRALPLPRFDLIQPIFFLKSIGAFFDFPHESAFGKLSILNSGGYYLLLAGFVLLLLPLFLLIVEALFNSSRFLIKDFENIFLPMNKNTLLKWFFVFCLLSVLMSLYPSLTIIREQEPYIRYLLPGLVFFALLLGKVFDEQKKHSLFAMVALLSLIIFCAYSFAMTSTSAVFYYNIQEKNMPLYGYLNAHNEITSVVSMQNARAIEYYTGRETFVLANDNQYSVSDIKKISPTPYIAVGCYNENLLASVKDLFDNSKTSVVFEKDCAKLLRIN